MVCLHPQALPGSQGWKEIANDIKLKLKQTAESSWDMEVIVVQRMFLESHAFF